MNETSNCDPRLHPLLVLVEIASRSTVKLVEVSKLTQKPGYKNKIIYMNKLSLCLFGFLSYPNPSSCPKSK